MYFEQTMQLLQWIETLQEPYKFLVYMLLYVGLPVLMVILLYINNKQENKKMKMNRQ